MTAAASHHDHDHDHDHNHDHSSDPASRLIERHTDVAIIGGSAAGLATALQLSRQRRSVIVIDSGEPRNAPATSMHSYLGHEGRSPADFLRIAREEVRSYGAEVLIGRATDVSRTDEGFLVTTTGGHTVRARRVVAATGLADEIPDIPGLAEHWGHGVIHCPFCHGYEARDQRIIALITSPMGLHPLPLLRQLTDRLTVVVHGGVSADEPELDTLRAAGVDVVVAEVEHVLDDGSGTLTGVRLADGSEIGADSILIGTRMHARLDSFAGVGLSANEHPSGVATYVEADPMTGATKVPGVYAVGSLTEPMLQVLPTAAAGSRVGGMIAFDLAREDLAAAARPSANQADWDGRYSGDAMWSGNPNGSVVAEAGELSPGTALDIGAGEGGDAIWLAEHGWTVTASDVSGQALQRIRGAAEHRGVTVRTALADANAAEPFDGETFDLVTAAYASVPRTPDNRAVANMLDAVAPGGRLLVINHDIEAMHAAMEGATDTRPFDPDAYVRTADIAAAIAERDGWVLETEDLRERPAGAVSTNHVHDVVLRAHRTR